jgi:hypothetical protein
MPIRQRGSAAAIPIPTPTISAGGVDGQFAWHHQFLGEQAGHSVQRACRPWRIRPMPISSALPIPSMAGLPITILCLEATLTASRPGPEKRPSAWCPSSKPSPARLIFGRSTHGHLSRFTAGHAGGHFHHHHQRGADICDRATRRPPSSESAARAMSAPFNSPRRWATPIPWPTPTPWVGRCPPGRWMRAP